MDAWGLLRTVPIGIVFFGGTMFALLRRKAGRGLARREYPSLASKLGLRLEEPRYPGWTGKLVGQSNGRQILVDPDESSRLSVTFARPLGVDLRSYERWKRCPPGFESFTLGREWDSWLVNRFCTQGLADALYKNDALTTCLAELRAAAEHLSQLTIDGEKVEVVVDFGTPAHVPARVVEKLVPALIRAATILEQLLERASLTPPGS